MAYVNGVYHPTRDANYNPTGNEPGAGQLGVMASSAGALIAGLRADVDPVKIQRMPNNSDWSTLDPGVYRIETTPHAQGLTPTLPAGMQGAGIMRIVTVSSTYRTYEYVGNGGRGTWHNTRDNGTLAGWQRHTTGGLDFQLMPDSSNWAAQPDGVYRITSYEHAQSLTPTLPPEMLGWGVMRVTSSNDAATDRLYEWISGDDRGVWVNTRTGGVNRGWRRLQQGNLDFQRMPNNSQWAHLPDGIYRIETFAHAQTLDPLLPVGARGSGIMRITSPSSTTRVYELVSGGDRGIWYCSMASDELSEWRQVGGAGAGDVTKEDLLRYVQEGDSRLYDQRRPLDTGWRLIDTSDTTGTIRTGGSVSLRRSGDMVSCRFDAVALASGSGAGLIFAPPAGFAAAGTTPVLILEDVTGTRRPIDITPTGIRWPSGSRPPNPLSGIVTWPTSDDTTVFYEEA